MAGIPAGKVRFTDKHGEDVTLWLNGVARPTGDGFGGFVVVARDGAKGIVDFDGVNPEGWTVPVLIDGWADDDNQQSDWAALWDMAAMDEGKPSGVVKVRGTVPPQLSKRKWLIQSITPGDGNSTLTDDRNRLLRDTAVITLIEPETADLVNRPVRKAQRKSGKSKKRHPVKARKDDTLITIAARELGDPGRWHEIADANPGVADPTRLKRDQVIKLP